VKVRYDLVEPAERPYRALVGGLFCPHRHYGLHDQTRAIAGVATTRKADGRSAPESADERAVSTRILVHHLVWPSMVRLTMRRSGGTASHRPAPRMARSDLRSDRTS
jgi:hypothetical protein